MDTGEPINCCCCEEGARKRYEEWERETQKWADKYRTGELSEIPKGVIKKYIENKKGSLDYQSGYNDAWAMPPEMRGFLAFKTDGMSLFELLKSIEGK